MRKKGIIIYRLTNELEEIDRKNVLLKGEKKAGSLRGHNKKLGKEDA